MARVHNIIPQTRVVSSTALDLTDWTFTQAQIDGADCIILTTDEPIRYLSTGTPTATFGHIVGANETVMFRGAGLGTLQFVKEGATDANVTIELDTFVTV